MIRLVRRQKLERAPRCDPHIRFPALRLNQGKFCDFPQFLFAQFIKRHKMHRIQQGKCLARIQLLRPVIPNQKCLQKFPQITRRRMINHRCQHIFQVITDAPFLLQHQLMIRSDDHFQILLPDLHHALLGNIRHARRALLAVTGVELRDHVSDQPRRLRADVALTVHQKLI